MPQLIIPAVTIGAGLYTSRQQEKSAKSAQEAQEAALAQQQQTAQTQGQEIKAAGREAAEKITAAGKPTEEESARQARYKGKALTPGEELMTQAGPISQAVARRIQANVERPAGTYEEGSLMPAVREQIEKRVKTPGLDFDTSSADFERAVGEPVWRALKARGIAPPPGSEGGGLGTQQYMKQVVPYLTEQRQAQVNKDIEAGNLMAQYEDALSRGDINAANNYANQAREMQQYYEGVENVLSEAIRQRLYESGIASAEAEQRGVEGGASTIVSGTQPVTQALTDMFGNRMTRAQEQQDTANAAIWQALKDIFSNIPTGTENTSTLYGGAEPTKVSPSAGLPTTTYQQLGTSGLPLALLQRLQYSK